jgi:GT2 family glycosyltransferase
MPDLCALIVSYNTRDLLLRCLRSLFAAGNEAGLGVEAIVVDNGSTDGSVVAVAAEFPQVRLLTSGRNLGFAGANNLALARSIAPVTLLLNSDAFVTGAALRRGYNFVLAAPEVGIAGLRLVNPDGSFQAAYGTFPTLWDDLCLSLGLDQLARRDEPDTRRVGPVDWVHGACLFVRTTALRQVGPLDERFFMYSEEVDWCHRFWSAGWEVWYLGDVAITHVGGASHLNDLNRRLALYRGRLGLRRRFGGPLSSVALWIGIVVGLAARVAVRAAAVALSRRQLGRQTPRADWDLARQFARLDPLARWAD